MGKCSIEFINACAFIRNDNGRLGVSPKCCHPFIAQMPTNGVVAKLWIPAKACDELGIACRHCVLTADSTVFGTLNAMQILSNVFVFVSYMHSSIVKLCAYNRVESERDCIQSIQRSLTHILIILSLIQFIDYVHM